MSQPNENERNAMLWAEIRAEKEKQNESEAERKAALEDAYSGLAPWQKELDRTRGHANG
jgi:hypothetical protein